MIPATVVIERMMQRTGKTVDDLRERDRHPDVVLIRHALMRDLYHESAWSVSAIGRLLQRNHSTVLHAVTGSRHRPRRRDHVTRAWRERAAS